MRRIVVSEFVTLDGVAEEPGKWSFPFWSGGLADQDWETVQITARPNGRHHGRLREARAFSLGLFVE